MRERLPLVIAIFVLVFAAAVAYVGLAEKVYRGQADVLVMPVTNTDPLAGQGVIVESGTPTLAVETASQLLSTPEVARRAINALGPQAPTQDPLELLKLIEVNPVSQTNIVAFVAEDENPGVAARYANAMAQAAIAIRDEQLEEQLEILIPRLQASIAALPKRSPVAQELTARLADIRVRDSDPSLRVVAPAIPQKDPVSPKVVLTLVAGAIAGLLIGLLVAVAIRTFDPRLRRVEQLRELSTLPILTSIPFQSRAPDRTLAPTELGPGAVEALRALRTAVAARAAGESISVLVAGPSAGDGKSTTAMGLASACAAAGSDVILIEADLRAPSIGRALRVDPERGVVGVLTEQASLERSLTRAPMDVGGFSMLLSDYEGPGNAGELFALPVASRLVADAKRLADVVIIDSPPVSEGVDALPLAQQVDLIAIVARIGHSRLSGVRDLEQILRDSSIEPTGFVLLDTD